MLIILLGLDCSRLGRGWDWSRLSSGRGEWCRWLRGRDRFRLNRWNINGVDIVPDVGIIWNIGHEEVLQIGTGSQLSAEVAPMHIILGQSSDTVRSKRILVGEGEKVGGLTLRGVQMCTLSREN